MQSKYAFHTFWLVLKPLEIGHFPVAEKPS